MFLHAFLSLFKITPLGFLVGVSNVWIDLDFLPRFTFIFVSSFVKSLLYNLLVLYSFISKISNLLDNNLFNRIVDSWINKVIEYSTNKGLEDFANVKEQIANYKKQKNP